MKTIAQERNQLKLAIEKAKNTLYPTVISQNQKTGKIELIEVINTLHNESLFKLLRKHNGIGIATCTGKTKAMYSSEMFPGEINYIDF